MKRLGSSFPDDLRNRRDAVFKKNFGVPPPECPPGPGGSSPETTAPGGKPVPGWANHAAGTVGLNAVTADKGQGAGNIGSVGILGRSFPYRRRQCN